MAHCDWVEFAGKRESAVSTNERLQQEAQAVLDVIENPDVAQALRQDKSQNLQYLKDNYNVRQSKSHFSASLTRPIADTGTNHRVIQFWPISIHIRQLQRRCRLPVPLPRTFYRYRT